MYRTGDLARQLPHGNFEYLGPAHDQIKIRGYRIELGEIETVLAQIETVKEAIVKPWEPQPGSLILAAYIQPRSGAVLASAELRGYLEERLPDYMIPSVFVMIDKMPLTPSGKVDRRALPEPGAEDIVSTADHVAPRNEQEEMLAGIWCGLLGITSVGIYDSFIELGGHSLLAIRMENKARNAGLELNMQRFFERHTIAALMETDEGADFQSLEKSAGVIATIGRIEAENRFPASLIETRFWFLSQFPDGAASYNNAWGFDIDGALDMDLLRSCVATIAQRHDVLRSTYAIEDGEVWRNVTDGLPVDIPLIDARGHEDELPAWKREAASCRFDVNHGPVWSMCVYRTGETGYFLLLNLHHIISDGWSGTIFMSELQELYAAAREGRMAELPELKIRYGDYAAWQAQRLDPARMDAHSSYWKNKLENFQTLELPHDHPRPAIRAFDGATVNFTMSKPLGKLITRRSRGEGTTAFMILLAAFKTLLARYCGQEDILVGTPVSNRSPEETEPLIGLFLNTIVLRTDLSGDPTFRELLNRVKQTTFEAFIHQELPFDQVVDQLNVPRETSLPPVYQVAFSLNSYPFPGMNLAGMPMTETAVDIGLSHNDVWVSIDEDERGLRGAVAYNTSLFDRPTIERMTTHFLNVLEAACADPSKRVSEVALFPAAEQEQMLVEWNATQADYPRDRTMHELFEEQAALNPDAPAVLCGDDVCTYGELNQRANRLAHHLRGLGVGTDTCVGLCLERSVEMVVGMLGILKAGGAYVPIDPAYPAERIRHIVDDSGLELIVAVGDVPPVPAHTSLVALDELDLSACPDTNPAAAIGPTNLAYVIFTSGSTGKPKGVMVEHRGVVRLVKNSSYVTLGPETRSLLIASFAFDGSVIEIWGALLNGGSLMLYPPEKPNLGTLGQLLRKQEINMLHLSAELFRAMVDERIDDLRGVRQLLVGGDVMPVAQTGRVLSELSGCRLINSYGPTENTVCTCSYSMTGPERFGTSVPIGKPVSNSIVYILDEQLNPVPVGAVGELYTGGDGLARGYVNQPGLTAEVFIADPFSADPAARLYRTGDRARWLPDGRIEFCGRHDRQVKIRGYRIELDDVENVLSRHEALAQVAVTAPDAPTGGRCLAAYFTVMRNRHVEENELREYLKAHLPEYMVPQYFLEMDALPLTSSGKINRKSLPRPGSEAMASGGQYVAPRTRLEKQMAQIWCAVLEVEKVGIHDNFFDLGGHSLLLIRALNKAQNEGIQVGLPLMYLHQTIAELCSELKDVQTSEKPREKLPAIGRIAAEMEFPLSFVEARFWFLSQFEAGASNYNIAWSYIIDGELDIGIFRACINTIAERHDVLRSTYEIRNGEPMRVVAAPAPVEVPLRDFRGREKELMHLLPEEARTPFDLTAGPLWRIAVCRIGKAEYQMVFNIHHIISDGWSSRLFMSELQELYGATLTGRPADLPELKIRYGDYAEWQRACIEGGRMEEHSSYWENKLENFQTLELPHDRPRPAMQTFNGAIHRFSIARPMEEQLRKRSREEGVTPFVILLAAFKLLLARYSGQRDIVIGTPVANRTRDEVEALLGIFLNTIALRTDLSGDITCRELLGRVQQTVVEGFEHQEVSFDRVVDLLHVTRDASLSPVYQVMFSLNRFPPLELKLGDMPIRPQEIDLDLSVTDLWVSIDEDESGMHGCFDYNTDLFDAATAERMTEHFLNVLVNVCADPSQKIADVALLSTPEREQVLVGWNATQTDYPRDKSIHTIFEEFTAKEPDAVAVVSGEDTFSYAEVNARANRLAHCLIKQGIDDASLVGLSFERSPEMLVCILGILKAGGAYVPLDSSYPTERLSVMVADCEPVLLIGGCDQPPIASGIPFIAFNGLDLAAFPETNPVVETSSENLAYVMYTSGSTGKPKGVMVPHRGVVRLVKNTNYVQLGPDTRTLHFAPIAFDASTFELWAPLLNGGSVVVYPAEKPSLQMLGRTIRESGVNTLWLTADLFRAMVDECLDDLRGVQQLLAGGDVLPVPQVRRVLAELKRCQLVNGYGPTENTTFTCCNPMPNAADFGSSVPIGRPIANTTVYILDSKMNPVPIGVAGELYTGGDGLACGYLNQPELTAAAFVPDPFSDDPEARLYRTGDRARYLPDGQVEFLGRNDRQVKIRGYRIELDGIENVLGCHEALTQVAVTAPDT
ncbi:MAG: amino acid adenylation domain-containing protein, partial [Kiritimatiellales bacterium]|nr:amino acid adenylation domain-containing protein [Kiritimatiellales bacterium]